VGVLVVKILEVAVVLVVTVQACQGRVQAVELLLNQFLKQT